MRSARVPPPPATKSSTLPFGAGGLDLGSFGGGEGDEEESPKKASRMLKPGAASSASASVGGTSPGRSDEEGKNDEEKVSEETLLEARRSFGEREGAALRSEVIAPAPSAVPSPDDGYSSSRSPRAREPLSSPAPAASIRRDSASERRRSTSEQLAAHATPALRPSTLVDASRNWEPAATSSSANPPRTSTSGIPSSHTLFHNLASPDPLPPIRPFVARSRTPSRSLPPLTNEEKAEQLRRRQTGESVDFGLAPWETKGVEAARAWQSYRAVRLFSFVLRHRSSDSLIFAQFKQEKLRLERLVHLSSGDISVSLFNRLAALHSRQPVAASRFEHVNWIGRSVRAGACEDAID